MTPFTTLTEIVTSTATWYVVFFYLYLVPGCSSNHANMFKYLPEKCSNLF